MGDIGRQQYTQGVSLGSAWKDKAEASIFQLSVYAALPSLQVSPATPVLTVIFVDSAKVNLGV